MFLTIHLKNFVTVTGKHLCWSLFLIKLQAFWPATLLKKNTPTKMFSYEYRETFKTRFFYRTSLAAASETEEFQDNRSHKLQLQVTLTNNQQNVIPQNILNNSVHMYKKLRITFLQNF